MGGGGGDRRPRPVRDDRKYDERGVRDRQPDEAEVQGAVDSAVLRVLAFSGDQVPGEHSEQKEQTPATAMSDASGGGGHSNRRSILSRLGSRGGGPAAGSYPS